MESANDHTTLMLQEAQLSSLQETAEGSALG